MLSDICMPGMVGLKLLKFLRERLPTCQVVFLTGYSNFDYLYAAENTVKRIGEIRSGDFNSAEANRYIRDNIEKASDIMIEMMELLGYANWRD